MPPQPVALWRRVSVIGAAIVLGALATWVVWAFVGQTARGDTRPGNGFGDPNHCHTGPPGQVGKPAPDSGCAPVIPPAPGSRQLRSTTAAAHTTGGPVEPFTPAAEEERNEDETFQGFPEGGPLRGTLSPSNNASSIAGGALGPASRAPLSPDPLTMFKNTDFQASVAFSGVPPDMSGADNGQTVLTTGNTFAAVSTDGGDNFATIPTTSIFPSGFTRAPAPFPRLGKLLDKGLCCDQIVQYVPKIDRFIWLMQFCGVGSAATPNNCLQGTNKIRIAAASTADVRAGATRWTYWDLSSATFGLDTTSNPNMDYPDLSFGDNFLYMSVDNVGAGLLVARIPLSEIANGQTADVDFTTPSDSGVAYSSHLTQNVTDTAYWAGHVSNSQMRIFTMREGEGIYSWRDVDVNSWCNGTFTSTTPGGTDWLTGAVGAGGAAPGFPLSSSGRGMVGTRRVSFGIPTSTTQLWFAWNAGKTNATGTAGTCGFAQSHVEIVVLNADDFSKISQMQVWNSTIAFGYPALASNTAVNQDIGMSLMYGGGGNEANHAIGFWGDFVVYSTTSSTTSSARNGDYHTIRRFTPNTTEFSTEGYGDNATGFDPHYVVFGRPIPTPPK